MEIAVYHSVTIYELLVRRAFVDAESTQKFRCYNAYRRYSLSKERFNFNPKKFNEDAQFESLKNYLTKTIKQLIKKKLNASNKSKLQGLVSDISTCVCTSEIDSIVEKALEYSRELIDKD